MKQKLICLSCWVELIKYENIVLCIKGENYERKKYDNVVRCYW